MSRPISIQRDVILETARKVFLEHGYQASTAQVARSAGISEGSLFKHFKTKNALFLAAMDMEISGATWQDLLSQSIGIGDLHRTLEAAGLQMLQHFQILLPRIIMVRSSGIVLTGPHQCGSAPIPHPVEKLRALTAYFRAEVKRGRLVMANPAVQAQVFFGALAHYVFQQTIFGYRPAPPKVYIRTVVDMILRAAMPEAKPGAESCCGTVRRPPRQRGLK